MIKRDGPGLCSLIGEWPPFPWSKEAKYDRDGKEANHGHRGLGAKEGEASEFGHCRIEE